MTEDFQLHCPTCGVNNRIPLDKSSRIGKCGRCGHSLPLIAPDHPVIVNDHSFSSEVLSSPLPVLVDFWAPWCHPCRSLAPTLELVAREYAGRIKLAKLNTDENPQVSGSFQVRSIPTLILFEQGRIKNQIVGALPAQQLRNWLNRSMGWL